MAGIPTVTVEIYLDAFATWTDVSGRVLKDRGLTMARGRSSEFDTSSPGTLRFTLDNADPGSDYGLNSLNYGYGVLKKNNKVRVKVGALQVWQGRIDTITWTPGTAPGASVVEVTATDDFKSYAKSTLGPFAVETCKGDVAWTGGAVYPMIRQFEGIGTYHAAWRDPAADKASIVSGSVGGREYNESGPPFIGRAMRLIPRGQVGPLLKHPTTWDPATEYGLVSFWFRTEADESSYLFDMRRTSGGSGYFAILLNATTGRLTLTAAGDSGGSATATPSGVGSDELFDGDWHHVAAWLHPKTGGSELRYYIDGQLKTVVYSATAITIGSSNRVAHFGGKRNAGFTDNEYVLNGEIAAPAIWLNSAVTDAPANWYGDGTEGGPGSDTIANQITNLRNATGAPAVTTANLSGYQVGGQQTDRRSYLDCMQELASSELGVFYIDRLGDPKLRGYGARDSAASVTLTVSATQDLAGDVQLVLDDATYANTVRATGSDGTTTVYDSGLLATDGVPLVDEWTTMVAAEADLDAMADNRLDMRKTSTPRLGRITIDLLTSPNSIESTALQLVPLDRVRTDDLDADLFGATTYDGFVEGWELSISTDRYAVTLDLSPVI